MRVRISMPVAVCVLAWHFRAIQLGKGRDGEGSEQRQRVLNLVPNIYLATILFATFSILRLI